MIANYYDYIEIRTRLEKETPLNDLDKIVLKALIFRLDHAYEELKNQKDFETVRQVKEEIDLYFYRKEEFKNQYDLETIKKVKEEIDLHFYRKNNFKKKY